MCWYTAYTCIHIPTLVISARLPGGSLALMGDELPQKCNLKIVLAALEKESPIDEEIYSIPACLPTHPRYGFIINRSTRPTLGGYNLDDWDYFQAEIDLSIPGPIKGISAFSKSHGKLWPFFPYTYICSNDDLFLTFPSVKWGPPHLNHLFLRIGMPPEEWREVKVEGMDKMQVSELHVDKRAGYIIAWVKENRLLRTRESSFIWGIDERKPDCTPVMDLISGRTRRLLWGG